MISERNSVEALSQNAQKGITPSANAVIFLVAQTFSTRKEQRFDFSAWSHGHALPVLFMGAAPRNCIKVSPAFLFSSLYIYGI